MDIAIVGTGYVGLVSGTCFAEMGINVTCVDVNEQKIQSLLHGEIPIYEPGLDDLVRQNVEAGRLHFTTDLTTCLDNVDVVFSAVGTPPDEDGSADLKYVLEVARTFGQHINKYTLLVTKSTVPVGTARKVKEAIQTELDKRGVHVDFDVASNPEFLKEGAAIKDFMSPDRVVVGTETERARKIMSRLYKPFMVTNDRMIFTDIPSAGCTIRVYDPIAMNECRRRVGDAVVYCKDMYEAALDSDALLLVTEWKQFRIPSFAVLSKMMNHRLIIDGRNIYDRQEIEENGFRLLQDRMNRIEDIYFNISCRGVLQCPNTIGHEKDEKVKENKVK
jgi:UDP-glucose 6-dehydrogenase